MPSRAAAILTLRPNGEGGEPRRIIIVTFRKHTSKWESVRRGRHRGRVPPAPGGAAQVVIGSARHDQIDGLRPLALLVGLDVERDALAFREALQPGPLDRRDVD